MPRNNRRTTLGVVNGNRDIDGLNNATTVDKKKNYKKRMSMAPRLGGVPPTPKTPSRTPGKSRQTIQSNAIRPNRIDPRHLSDKSFQNGCIHALMNYLTSSGYDQPISPKILGRPSTKDFNQIVTYLLRRVDPYFNDGSMKLEDEVPLVFKSLGYPFPISKTALVAAGAPNTWPSLLAALKWLIEANERFDISRTTDDSMISDITEDGNTVDLDLAELADKSDKYFVKYICEAYQAFLLGDDERNNSLDNSFIDFYEKGHMKVEREIAKISQINQDLATQIENMESGDELIPELEKKRECLCTDLEKFYELVKQLNEHKSTLEVKVRDHKTELEKNERELSQVKKRIETLQTRVDSQDLSIEDVERLRDEKVLIKEAIEKIAEDKLGQNKIVWECEVDLKKKYDELEVAVSSFNARLSKLLSQPLISEGVGGKAFLIKVDRSWDGNTGQQGILGVDICGDMLPTLCRLGSYCCKLTEQAREENKKLEDLKLESEESLRSATTLTSKLKVELKTKEDVYKHQKETQDAAIMAHAKEMEKIKTKMAALNDPKAFETEMMKLQDDYNRLVAELDQVRDDAARRKRAVQKEVIMALGYITDHREFIDTALTEMTNYLKNVLDGGIERINVSFD